MYMYMYMYIYIYIYIYITNCRQYCFGLLGLISAGAKLRVTENRCVIFNRSTHVYLALLPQH